MTVIDDVAYSFLLVGRFIESISNTSVIASDASNFVATKLEFLEKLVQVVSLACYCLWKREMIGTVYDIPVSFFCMP